MQLLNTELANHALPPYDSLSGLQKIVLTAKDTRLGHLHSSLPTEPLDPAEIATAVQHCAIVTPRLAHLDAVLTANFLPASQLLTTVAVGLLMADPALAPVFSPEPVDDTQLATVVLLAIQRLAPALRPAPRTFYHGFGGSSDEDDSSRRSYSPIICSGCGNSGAFACIEQMCCHCCRDRYCDRHRSGYY